MAKPKDFLLDEDLDLVIVNGDAVMGFCTAQNQQKILMLNQGELKHAPLIGVCLQDWLLDDGEDILSLQHKIQDQFETDGQIIRKLDVTGFPHIKLVAEYE